MVSLGNDSCGYAVLTAIPILQLALLARACRVATCSRKAATEFSLHPCARASRYGLMVWLSIIATVLQFFNTYCRGQKGERWLPQKRAVAKQ